MSIIEVLREKEEQLADLYQTNIESARSLQETLGREILPGLVDELNLDEEGEQRARSWLYDLRTSRLSQWLLRILNIPSPLYPVQSHYSDCSKYAPTLFISATPPYTMCFVAPQIHLFLCSRERTRRATLAFGSNICSSTPPTNSFSTMPSQECPRPIRQTDRCGQT